VDAERGNTSSRGWAVEDADIGGISPSKSVIRIYRPGSRVGVVVLNPAFEILIDDSPRGSIWPKQVRSFPVTAGTHEVKVRSLGYRLGRRKSVTISPGQNVDLVLPHEWVMSLTGQIKLHEASETDLRALKTLLSTLPDSDNVSDGG